MEDDLENLPITAIPGPCRIRKKRIYRVHRGRAGGAAGGGYRGCVPRRWPEDFRSHEASGETGNIKGFCQGFHAASRHSHRRVCNLYSADAAIAMLDEKGAPIVIKADGLAAGKALWWR